MDELWATGGIIAMMAVVVLVFRALVRRPRHMSLEDPPGLRTVVVFHGDEAEFFQDDRPDGPLVGNRLFESLLAGLAARQVGVENRGRLENAQRAECVVEDQRFALVLERIEDRWAASVEWVAPTRAERRHLAWTHEVFAPPDSGPLRHLLSVLADWLNGHAQLSRIQWHRKEKWFLEDASEGSVSPFIG